MRSRTGCSSRPISRASSGSTLRRAVRGMMSPQNPRGQRRRPWRNVRLRRKPKRRSRGLAVSENKKYSSQVKSMLHATASAGSSRSPLHGDGRETRTGWPLVAGRYIDLSTTHSTSYNSQMKRASITDAKNGLSALLDRVRHGETVVIEDRGIPVAQLTPVAARSTSADAGRLARLERQGIVRPAASPGAAKLPAGPPPRARRPVTLSQLVIAERREGW